MVGIPVAAFVFWDLCPCTWSLLINISSIYNFTRLMVNILTLNSSLDISRSASVVHGSHSTPGSGSER